MDSLENKLEWINNILLVQTLAILTLIIVLILRGGICL
jgi:hypothetical protein